MAENKKYWYLQLNVNFFEDERIDWLAEQNNGYAYVVLYLKLCLKTANNNGILTRQIGDMIIPYDVNKIAEITKMNVDVVRVALELYKKIGLVYEADENCNFMRLPEVPSMVGYTTQYAIDKAKYREKKKQLALDIPQDNVQMIVQDTEQDIPSDNVRQELRVKSKELKNKREGEKTTNVVTLSQEKNKLIFGEFQNVQLTQVELDKLNKRWGTEQVESEIENLSIYLENNPKKKYNSHYATLLNWLKRDYSDEKQPVKSAGTPKRKGVQEI